MRIRPRVGIAAFLALGASMALVAPAALASAPTPFKAEITLQASFTPTTAPGVLSGTTSGAGHASHLGRVTLTSTEVLDLTAAPGRLTVRDGHMVMVAANGDELHWSYGGGGPLPDANGDSDLTGTFVITGGTGRFEDAVGGGTAEGAGSVVTGIASFSYRGTITY
jgi:hypothetical protein